MPESHVREGGEHKRTGAAKAEDEVGAWNTRGNTSPAQMRQSPLNPPKIIPKINEKVMLKRIGCARGSGRNQLVHPKSRRDSTRARRPRAAPSAPRPPPPLATAASQAISTCARTPCWMRCDYVMTRRDDEKRRREVVCKKAPKC